MGDKVRRIVTVGLLLGAVWYVGDFNELLDFRTPDKKGHKEWCDVFVSIGAISEKESEQCAQTRDAYMDAATTAARQVAKEDAEILSQVSKYLENKAKTINLDLFEPYDGAGISQVQTVFGAAKLYPPRLDHNADDVETDDYDRTYLDVNKFEAEVENENKIEELVIKGCHEKDQNCSFPATLPDPVGYWKDVLYLLTRACPMTFDSDFEGCRARIFIQSVWRRQLGHKSIEKQPAVTFMLLDPIKEEVLFEYYYNMFSQKWPSK